MSIISFSKTMTSSVVTPPYHLRLPREFCDEHLPRHNANIILVGESEKEYNLNYLVNGHRVIGVAGWGCFVVEHGLIVGDNLSFRLIGKYKFKVHITRAGRSVENECESNKPADFVKSKGIIEEDPCTGNTATQKKRPASVVVDTDQYKILCGIQGRVDEEVVPAEMMNQLKLALSSQYFSFCKKMEKTYMCRSELSLPKTFCDAHLPCDGGTVILVDETQREYNVTYSVKVYRLLGGWRNFAIECGLLEGDIVVFQLVDRCKFKVQIIRASRCIGKEFQNNMPLNFVKTEDLTEDNGCKREKVSRAVDIHQVYVRRKYRSTETKGAYDSDSAAPSRFENAEPALSLKCFEDFKICVNGEMLDSEIPVDIRVKYYELCCVEKGYLHDNVMKDLNSKLVVSMIQDIVSFAESMKSTSISTRLHHLESMDRTLKSFEDLGMTVGSLRAKIGKLIKILKEHHSVAESTIVRLEALECERKAFMEKKAEIDELIASAMAQGKLIGRLEENIDGSKEKMDKLSVMLKEVAGLTQ